MIAPMKPFIQSIVCLDDFRIAAKESMPIGAFEYFDSGSGEEITKQQNEKSFHQLMIIPRILKSISQPSMNTKIFGKDLKLPFGMAPTAMQAISHPEGEAISATVAYEKGLIMCLSTLSNKSFREVSQANQSGMRLFQMYVSKDWEMTMAAVRLAEKYKF
jgi:isopentenyl diphosphate isomerase/L-lactate dehydrogenase-like FMN-dependent dehydrogenase